MLKKFLFVLAFCNFTQPVQAREVLALQAATAFMMGATAACLLAACIIDGVNGMRGTVPLHSLPMSKKKLLHQKIRPSSGRTKLTEQL